ncbi:MAG: hypothetical protein KatS3mg113_0294 [Planctomycetaceae bacterium]|nr:MAG: hypothetical protein KatS3mg113_0294 [Planctomycetaceae bacterium]
MLRHLVIRGNIKWFTQRSWAVRESLVHLTQCSSANQRPRTYLESRFLEFFSARRAPRSLPHGKHSGWSLIALGSMAIAGCHAPSAWLTQSHPAPPAAVQLGPSKELSSEEIRHAMHEEVLPQERQPEWKLPLVRKPSIPVDAIPAPDFSSPEGTIQPLSHHTDTHEESRSEVVMAAMAQPLPQEPTGQVPSAANPPWGVDALPLAPRWVSQDDQLRHSTSAKQLASASPQKQPEEYLFDGGDRGTGVHREEGWLNGLDPEDTVAEYVDHRGRTQLVPSNRVAIYSPRFAAVRSITLPQEEGTYLEPRGMNHGVQGSQVDQRWAHQLGVRNITAEHTRTRLRASGFAAEERHSVEAQRQRPQATEKVLNTHENSTFLLTGSLQSDEHAWLQDSMQRALAWSREQSPVIIANDEQAEIGRTEIHSSVITVFHDLEAQQPGQLRLVKLADHQHAQSGDIVTFTLRYDNLGPRELYEIRILDNLTPRLKYIEGTATSDREAEFTTQDNHEGSQILIWKLQDPLPPKTGGVLRFQALVQ